MIGVPITLPAPGHRKINGFGSRFGIWTRDSQHKALVKVPYGIVPTQRTALIQITEKQEEGKYLQHGRPQQESNPQLWRC